MKLSQRLTRAGLTFILLGSVAANMPQQSDSAMALSGTCTNGDVYVFGNGNSASTATTSNSSSVRAGTQTNDIHSRSLNAFLNNSPFAATFTFASTGTATDFTTATNSTDGKTTNGVIVTAPTDATHTGTINVTATFPGNKMLMFPLTINGPS